MILPMVNYLESHGVDFQFNTHVTDVRFSCDDAKDDDRKLATEIRLVREDGPAAVDAADLVLLVTTTGPIDLERMLETIRQINKPSSVLLTQTRYGTRSLRHAEEFLAENGLARCQETIPYKEAMRLAPDEGRFPSASGYGLIAKELSDAFAA